ncbi:orotidine 5'-phosphate decarboxylase [Candidatus Kaiserbacteria bacterium RIFCSPHIGHO2_02_FULL_55_20]|uniref:Orotidine-5'-phosphate decarboxylase n=1 Tax=Candidatus Kaiserbacteria bacterium RIFCSPHIGHO2_02_FULL_55_20 TaxID=1798497 RepID=A0A1F6DYA6_9BACT|nr:MAG: orotidine 5'-phosphate decarboxylase [Candidatus Kaiserbacteria bacterium RIFCSPHIGHO2_02_FULL_55_20]
MALRNFRQLLEAQWEKGKFLCVGLDSDLDKIPESAHIDGTRESIVYFNRAIVDATKDLVCSYKPNPAFYEAHGDEGWQALRETIQYIHEVAPDVAVILDAKRADIGNTNEAYAKSAFEHLHADAITVNPYLGSEPLAPFFDRKDKGVIVLCHTSNPGAGEIQNLMVEGEPLYKVIARLATTKWNGNGNCCLMVGATYPDKLAEVRKIAADMPILIAGVGAQNGDLEKTVRAGLAGRKGLMVNASRSIIFTSSGADFAERAREKATELDSAIRATL